MRGLVEIAKWIRVTRNIPGARICATIETIKLLTSRRKIVINIPEPWKHEDIPVMGVATDEHGSPVLLIRMAWGELYGLRLERVNVPSEIHEL